MVAATIGAHRSKAAERENKRAVSRAKSALSKYDKDGNKSIEKGELQFLLRDLCQSTDEADLRVSHDLVNFILNTCDVDASGGIDLSEVKGVYDAYQSYLENENEMMTIFNKYDADGSARIEPEELAKILTDLNDGNPVPQKEIDWVVGIIDTMDGEVNVSISKAEVMFAVNLWYSQHPMYGKRFRMYYDETAERAAVAVAAKERLSTMTIGESRKKAAQECHRLAKLHQQEPLVREADLLEMQYQANFYNRMEMGPILNLLGQVGNGDHPSAADNAFVSARAVGTLQDGGGYLDRRDIDHALVAWKAFKQEEPKLEAALNRQDPTGDLKLGLPELHRVMQELNDGKKVTDDEALWVANKGGLLDTKAKPNRLEVLTAIGLWYAHHDQPEVMVFYDPKSCRKFDCCLM